MNKDPIEQSMTSLTLLAMQPSKNRFANYQSVKNAVLGESFDWVQTGDLYDVALRLFAVSFDDRKNLDSKAVALFTKRLLEAEIAVGGPYKSNSRNDLIMNALILQLMQSIGVELANVRTYVRSEAVKMAKLGSLFLDEWWPLIWPSPIIDPSFVQGFHNPTSPTTHAVKSFTALPQSKSASKPAGKSNQTIIRVRREIMSLDEPVRSFSLKMLEKVVAADVNNEIAMLNSYFARSLVNRQPLSKNDLLDLDSANFYAWMAYAIYDDFIDEEGDPQLLSTANIAHRKSLLLYLNTANRCGMDESLIFAGFEEVDQRNLGELLNYRFKRIGTRLIIDELPEYGDLSLLADRAIGHINGPRMILSLHASLPREKSKMVYDGLRHYIIARQISDDLRDWSEDLVSGRASFVLCHLMREVGIKPGIYSLSTLKKKVSEYYWGKGLNELNLIALEHIRQSESLLLRSTALNVSSVFFKNVIRPITDSVEQSVRDWQEKRHFLEQYSQPKS